MWWVAHDQYWLGSSDQTEATNKAVQAVLNPDEHMNQHRSFRAKHSCCHMKNVSGVRFYRGHHSEQRWVRFSVGSRCRNTEQLVESSSWCLVRCSGSQAWLQGKETHLSLDLCWKKKTSHNYKIKSLLTPIILAVSYINMLLCYPLLDLRKHLYY